MQNLENESIFNRVIVAADKKGRACGVLRKAFELGLIDIVRTPDTGFTFKDHAGDSFCPITNPDIDPAELKRQEKHERARFNRNGVWFVRWQSVLKPNALFDSIGGFVGYDFIGSGYDDEALDQLQGVCDKVFSDLKIWISEAYPS